MHAPETHHQYLIWEGFCGKMNTLVAEKWVDKGQLSLLVEAICRDFRQHDEEELKKLVEWQKQVKTKSANKEKPARPDVAFWDELQSMGYNKRRKTFTPREIKAIFDWLGSP